MRRALYHCTAPVMERSAKWRLLLATEATRSSMLLAVCNRSTSTYVLHSSSHVRAELHGGTAELTYTEMAHCACKLKSGLQLDCIRYSAILHVAGLGLPCITIAQMSGTAFDITAKLASHQNVKISYARRAVV